MQMCTCEKERRRKREGVASPDGVNKDFNLGAERNDRSGILHNVRAWFHDDIMGMEFKVKRSDRQAFPSKTSRRVHTPPADPLPLSSRAYNVSHGNVNVAFTSPCLPWSRVHSVVSAYFARARTRDMRRDRTRLSLNDVRTLTRRRERRSHNSLLSHAGQSNTPNDTRTSSDCRLDFFLLQMAASAARTSLNEGRVTFYPEGDMHLHERPISNGT